MIKLKAFRPYTILANLHARQKWGGLDVDEATDPSGSEWRRIGLHMSPLGTDEPMVDLQSMKGVLLVVQINERMLPAKVRDEELKKRVAKLEELQGHKVSKKDYAQLRDQVEGDLLPKAFIRRTFIPVISYKAPAGPRMLLVFTTSQKRADDVLSLLAGIWPDLGAREIETARTFVGSLTTLASDGDNGTFIAADAAVLTGTNKKTIRIKNKPIADSDIETLLKEDYEVSELRMEFHEETDAQLDNPDLVWTVTDKQVFKGITLPDVKMTPLKEDQFAQVVLIQKTVAKALDQWLDYCGGLKVDEDDDL